MTCAWIETSSAETGSSSRISCGSTASARAIPMRWRWPPENSCGKRLRCSGCSPTRSSSSRRLGLDLVARHAARARSGVARIWRTRLRGFSDACGSWKTICISRRIGSSSLAARALVMSLPRKRIAPLGRVDQPHERRGSASSCRSRTRRRSPSVSPSRSANETSSTAWTWPTVRSMIRPDLIGNRTRRCSTSSRVPFAVLVGAAPSRGVGRRS